MYLAYVKKPSGVIYIYLKESTADPKTKKVTNRVVKGYGRMDMLQKEHPGMLEELQERYKSRSRRAYESQCAAIADDSCVEETSTAEEIHEKRSEEFNYGWLVFRRVWSHILRLNKTFSYLNDRRYQYNRNQDGSLKKNAITMNTIATLLICRKAMGGASIRKTHSELGKFIGTPKTSLSNSRLYRFLDYLYDSKGYIVEQINKNMDKVFGRERYSLLFYDATNTYFEVPMTDSDRGIVMPDYEEKLVELIEEGISNGELSVDCLSDDGTPNKDVLPDSFMAAVDKSCIKYLRQHGPSKEQRMDLPLISIVMVIDSKGIPVDYAVFPGNKSEFATMEPVLTDLKKRYNINNSAVVADRGLNSVKNLKMMEENGLGYVVAQKISQLGKDLTDEITSLNGYTKIPTEDGRDRRYKVFENFEKKAADGTSITCSLVVTFDEKRKARDDALINKHLKVLEKKIKDKAKVSRRRTTWSKFAKFDDEGSSSQVIGIDDAVVNKWRSLAGYAGFVFKASSSEEGSETVNEVTAEYVAGFYAKLNSIERCFRIMKSNIGLRPVHLRTMQHIHAHVLMCFIALILVCVLEAKMHEAGHMLSIDQILKVLNSMDLIKLKSRRVFETDEPIYAIGRWNDKEKYRFVDPETKEESEIPLPHAQYYILRTLGLGVPPSQISRTGLCGCLRTQFRAPTDGCELYL